MVAKVEKTGGGEVAAAAAAVVAASNHHSRRRRNFNKPSWLLCAIADLDERMKMVITKIPKEQLSGDSFAARANSYYHERPHLLALLNDFYNSYLSLADRYCQSLSKTKNSSQNSSRSSSPIPISKFEEEKSEEEVDDGEVIDYSDVESSLSKAKEMDADAIVAELVMKSVEYDIIMDELTVVEKRSEESSRKMELQENLLDVLESERLILLNDNATLGYRISGLVEENKGLASESLFLKRKAAELARCVLKTREDRRVCMLSRKIEDLQGQIYGLEKRNKEYYEQLVKQEEQKKRERGDLNGNGILRKCFSFNVKKVGDRNGNGNSSGIEGGKTGSKLWGKVKKFDMFLCGPLLDSGTC